MAFVVAIIGIQGAIGTSSILIVVICMVIGLVVGIALRLDDRINSLGDKIKDRLAGTKNMQGAVFGRDRHILTHFLCRQHGDSRRDTGRAQ